MLKLIIISAFRSLLKYKQMSLINLFGLVLGLTSFLFSVYYIVYEYSFDSFFDKSENIYRINYEVSKQGEPIYQGAKSPRGLFHAIREQIPEIEANGCAYFEKCQVLFEDTYYANQDILWVSEDFEDVFPLDMIAGVADYSAPRLGIISETAAKALFHDKDPVGRIMEVNGEMPIEITGVFKDMPSNTHLTAKYFVSYKTWVEMGIMGERGDWSGGWWNYIKMKKGVSKDQSLQKINGFVEMYMPFLADDHREASFSLQPLKDLHFIQGIDGEMGANTNYSSLINLIVVALFTLFIAWINYVNLSTAQAQIRSLQISMRKLVGASNIHVWHQSLAESIILNLFALTISFVIYLIFKNTFADFFNIPLKEAYIPPGNILLNLLAIVALGILFSSIYYGIYLARMNYIVGKDKVKGGKFKQGLVMVQMALSIIFLISTMVVYKQISFMKNKDLGIELNGVILCTGPASLNPDPQKREKYQGFKNEILSFAGFESATFNVFVPGMEPIGYTQREFVNPEQGVTSGTVYYENSADDGLINTYKIDLLAGNNFGISRRQNINDVLINQNALKQLGFENPEEAVGRWIFRRGDTTRLEIIGVVNDFHNEGLQKPIYPMVWNNNYPFEFGYFAIRVNTKNLNESLAQLKSVWNRHFTKDELNYSFADQHFNEQYKSESRYSKFYVWLTILSIAIATIGLYGLIVFYLTKRDKEIGLRKVNGASAIQVVGLLNKDFLSWIIISFVIAFPVSWYAMNTWLENFAYKTNLSWWVFAIAGMAVFSIAVLTVSLKSWKAASRNPVEALRYE
ncbi:MAG: FtsX-like permease family protein [Prolixibacteraceae bacterium]|nr:FtsX-like permease family protein [Prolixibacteraceae bacterium]